MSVLTTHVLDTVLGSPAAGVRLTLHEWADKTWTAVASGETDADGRCRDLVPRLNPGRYRLIFQTGDYLTRQGRSTLYPEIAITFECNGEAHYHLPLLLSENSYTTYRGS
ncbi:MAG TPA: hydroxyisourate hydrolase [Terracidiphilus sp.]|jgi:5-hydroxyisourate hydrolase|nr:hydroxyisourate hydrolase [Terracidiphilus sp.]